MYQNNYLKQNMRPIYPNNDNRFVGGGFLGPFILGGITGGLLAPAFYPRPIYGPVPYMNAPIYYPRPYTSTTTFY